ncbi:MAG: hypothetical protein GY793_11040 [Proteobacteria bacterium]|nr:hypothetical protein [Pseudomonadota bacterium]
MKKIMVVSQDPELIDKIKPTPNVILIYDSFMTVFEQLNFHSPDFIIFDFHHPCIDQSQSFMLESLPKKNEENYIKLVAIGANSEKEQFADFAMMFEDAESLNVDVF